MLHGQGQGHGQGFFEIKFKGRTARCSTSPAIPGWAASRWTADRRMSAVLQSLTKDLRAARAIRRCRCRACARPALRPAASVRARRPGQLYPASARGYSVANSYLLTQDDDAMLIDTGFGKDEPAMRADQIFDRA